MKLVLAFCLFIALGFAGGTLMAQDSGDDQPSTETPTVKDDGTEGTSEEKSEDMTDDELEMKQKEEMNEKSGDVKIEAPETDEDGNTDSGVKSEETKVDDETLRQRIEDREKENGTEGDGTLEERIEERQKEDGTEDGTNDDGTLRERLEEKEEEMKNSDAPEGNGQKGTGSDSNFKTSNLRKEPMKPLQMMN